MRLDIYSCLKVITGIDVREHVKTKSDLDNVKDLEPGTFVFVEDEGKGYWFVGGKPFPKNPTKGDFARRKLKEKFGIYEGWQPFSGEGTI